MTVRFTRVVFTIAGIWGMLIMTPLYFTFDAIGRAYPPPITHPDLYYGFVGVTLSWQVAFLVIASNPVRYRTVILPAILEKVLVRRHDDRDVPARTAASCADRRDHRARRTARAALRRVVLQDAAATRQV